MPFYIPPQRLNTRYSPQMSPSCRLLSHLRQQESEPPPAINVHPNDRQMKAQRYHSLGLAVLGSLLVLLSGSNVVAMSSSSSPLLDCTEASTGDGDCDLSNNTEECGRLEFLDGLELAGWSCSSRRKAEKPTHSMGQGITRQGKHCRKLYSVVECRKRLALFRIARFFPAMHAIIQ